MACAVYLTLQLLFCWTALKAAFDRHTSASPGNSQICTGTCVAHHCCLQTMHLNFITCTTWPAGLSDAAGHCGQAFLHI